MLPLAVLSSDEVFAMPLEFHTNCFLCRYILSHSYLDCLFPQPVPYLVLRRRPRCTSLPKMSNDSSYMPSGMPDLAPAVSYTVKVNLGNLEAKTYTRATRHSTQHSLLTKTKISIKPSTLHRCSSSHSFKATMHLRRISIKRTPIVS